MKKTITLLIFSLFYIINQANSQVTTSAISGLVEDENKEALLGSTVLAIHVPSGTQYGTTTNESGRYTIPNMRIGGPYKVIVSYVGYVSFEVENVFLKLGEKAEFNTQLQAGVVAQEIVVKGTKLKYGVGEKSAGSTSITKDLIVSLPTISRSTADYTRLNPMAAEGGSFAGRNDQFNNYSLDGSIFNNPFGLDAATPGGQTNAQPIPLDAIEQISVSVAPYDVTLSGFTGASINSVTKSGTNDLHGSVYGYYRNKSMIGGKVGDQEVNKGDLKHSQLGFSIGGPIVKDKLFYFVNIEREERSDFGSYFLSKNSNNSSQANVSRVLESDLQLVSSLLKEKFGYNTGAYQDFIHEAKNTKGIFKLSYNINNDHKLSVKYNFLDAFQDKTAHPSAIGRRGPDYLTLQFRNTGYRINNKLSSIIGELNSVFGNSISNHLQLGYTKFNDSRNPFSSPFPEVNISKDGIRYIVAGHEPFSINNSLNQGVLQFTNNLNFYKNNHTFTVGTALEKFSFDNSFNLGVYGGLVFAPDVDIKDFASYLDSDGFKSAVNTATTTYQNNNKNNTWALAETNIGQWSIYLQDDWTVNKKLKLSIGIRGDKPLYFDTKDKIIENLERNSGGYDPSLTYYNPEGVPVKLDHTILPKAKIQINPRFGFQYDIEENQSAIVRGGIGAFTGRMPFVWVGNQVANPNWFFYCITDPNFKFPQILRSNIGFDKTFNNGWKISSDLIYTKDLQSQLVKNYGLKLPTGTLNGVDNRPIYLSSDRALNPFGGATNAYVFTNSDLGRSLNINVKAEKYFNKSYLSIAYNYLDAKDVNSIDAEISSDAYDRNPANVQHTNTEVLAPSLYGNKHRIVGAASHRIDYKGGKMSTVIGLFFEYVSGRRYSYTYSGDINNDGSGLNDLIYIPSDAQIDQMAFSGDENSQRNALKQFIAQDDYLSNRRGQNAEKYGSLTPWHNRWDVKVQQNIAIKGTKELQLSLDILNVGNLISSSWGTRKQATETGLFQPIGVSVVDGTPKYSFDSTLKNTFTHDFSLNSRWQAQLGLKFVF